MILSPFLVLCVGASAQIDIPNILERKAKERAERKIDRTIDKGFDKTEQGIDKGSKEATKKREKDKDQGSPDEPSGKGGADTKGGDEEHGSAGARENAPTLKSYSKYDFVPGEQVIAVEDFQQDAIGDFPARWNTNSAGEVVTIEGFEGRWLQLNGDGIFYPEFLGTLPENTTIEFDVATNEDFSFYCPFVSASFVSAANTNLLRPDERGKVVVGVHPQNAGGGKGSTEVHIFDANGQGITDNSREQMRLVHRGIAPRAHVAIWRQKSRLRVYLDEEKVWDLPRAFQPGVEYRMILQGGGCEGSTPYVKDLRVAAGAPDTRNKLITEGRLVTRGILFDSGSDRITAGSAGTLKDIATVMSENPAVRVRIIGHTDSDGDEAENQQLSERRAASVKKALSEEYGIDAARMETGGKGETAPAGPNDTPQGKANNRRVEFVKL